MKEKVARLSSGEIKFMPLNNGVYGEAITLGYNQGVTLSRSSDVKQLLSHDNTVGEVVSEVEVNVQYEFKSDIGDISLDNLALVFNGAVLTKTYSAGDKFYNSKTIIDGASNVTGNIGDPVLKDNKIYTLVAAAKAKPFNECEFAPKTHSNSVKTLNAEKSVQAVGKIIVEGINLATNKSSTLVIPKLAIRFNGDFNVVGDEFVKLSITGKAQKTDGEAIFSLIDEA